MPSKLIELNGFKRSNDGVYSIGADRATFDYSDGEDSEYKLKQILSNAENLASDSSELEEHISDWPSEYHLSSTRANLLRCLDLSGVKRVLELGCGCGSITRYLGEQSHLEIDSIEGSQTRAALAALRCKNLDNVTISTANFNQINLPENYYDLVLFVGVTEYAGRFSVADNDEEALQNLLTLAKSATTEKGLTLIAIENRTGLKYLMGANEDHYGVPYIGVENYPNSTGIRTYTKQEWLQQISQAGFSNNTFLYPFPDYKLPTQIINQKAFGSTSQVVKSVLLNSFQNIKSRDYLANFDLGEKEARIWQGLYEAGSLEEHANSFLILLSDDLTSLETISDFDVKQFDDDKTYSYQTVQRRDEMKKNDSSNEKIKHLEEQLTQIHQSRSWRILDKIRPLLQTFKIGRK